MQIVNCSKCGEECVLGVNAITEHGEIICDSCSGVKRGFANLLLPEERKELIKTLKQDLRERPRSTKRDQHINAFMQNALDDAQ